MICLLSPLPNSRCSPCGKLRASRPPTSSAVRKWQQHCLLTNQCLSYFHFFMASTIGLNTFQKFSQWCELQQGNQHSREQVQIRTSAVDEMFVCLNLELLASNPKASENHVTKICSTNFRPSLCQARTSAGFALPSPPAWRGVPAAEVGHEPPPLWEKRLQQSSSWTLQSAQKKPSHQVSGVATTSCSETAPGPPLLHKLQAGNFSVRKRKHKMTGNTFLRVFLKA